MSHTMMTHSETRIAELKEENECVVCMEPCAKLSVLCCNGHRVCEKHYRDRAKAIYEEGRLAHGDDKVQRCFLCRTDIKDDNFSKDHFKKSIIVIFAAAAKKGDLDLSIKEKNELIREVLKSHNEFLNNKFPCCS